MTTATIPIPQETPRKAAVAAFVGSTLEYYDFFAYATASALVLGPLFFPNSDASVSLLSSFAAFGLAYVARPIGAIVFAHIGDKIGRRRSLVMTIVCMGIASLVVGFLPTYDVIGIAAPIILVLARLFQGFSAGAESAGASTLTLENSPEGRRGFFTSFTTVGASAGSVLASLVFFVVELLPHEQLLAWGWRVPFLLSFVLLIVGFVIRRRLSETPDFVETKKTHHQARVPIGYLLRNYGVEVFQVLLMAMGTAMGSIVLVFLISYATGPSIGFSSQVILILEVFAAAGCGVGTIFGGWLGDRFGRKPIITIGLIGCGITAFLMMWAIASHNFVLMCVWLFIDYCLFYGFFNGVYPSMYPEKFPTKVRYTGMAVGNSLGLIVAGFTPTIATALLFPGANGWLPAGIFIALVMIIPALGAITSRETAFTPRDQLGEDGFLMRRRARRERGEAPVSSPAVP